MVHNIDRQELQIRFLAALKGVTYCFIEGLNPFHILINETEYWIYIKNLTSAHFENPDVWRAQLPQRDDFNLVKESENDFILLGYDSENDVYATWNPVWVKQRLNNTSNVSFYSRYSLQQQARHELTFKRLELINDGEVVIFPRELIRLFFVNVSSFFLAKGDYVAIGSKRRPEANKAFKTFSDLSNVADFARYLADEDISQMTIRDYCRIIKNLLSDGTISRNRKLFLQHDFLTEYRNTVPQFVELDEVRKKNEKWQHQISAVLNSYIDFLTQISPEIKPEDNTMSIVNSTSNEKSIFNDLSVELHDDNTVSYATPTKPIKGSTSEPIVHDWEAEFTDSNGKLTRIANPELIDILRQHLNTDYPKKATAFNLIEHFYGDRFPSMTLADWGKLMNAINWADPYIHEERVIDKTSSDNAVTLKSPKRSKTHILRVEFPDGTILQGKNDCDTYANAIKLIDPELVALVDLSHAGVDIVSKTLDTKYARYQKPIGNGWYVMTNTSTKTKGTDLQVISNELELDLKISIIPLRDSEIITTTHTKVLRRTTHSKIRVIFPDGHISQPATVQEALLEVVKFAGADRVRELGIICCRENLILKTPTPIYKKRCKPVGNGWLCNTCSCTETKISQMSEISDKLGLRLKIEQV